VKPVFLEEEKEERSDLIESGFGGKR